MTKHLSFKITPEEAIEIEEEREEIKNKLLPTMWICRTHDKHWYPIQPSELCKAEDHGMLNNHLISDVDGNILWKRSTE